MEKAVVVPRPTFHIIEKHSLRKWKAWILCPSYPEGIQILTSCFPRKSSNHKVRGKSGIRASFTLPVEAGPLHRKEWKIQGVRRAWLCTPIMRMEREGNCLLSMPTLFPYLANDCLMKNAVVLRARYKECRNFSSHKCLFYAGAVMVQWPQVEIMN